MIGTTLSHYCILEKLGQGVTYRAHDTSLDRQLAIEVLPEVFASDPERMARFERETKLLASLSHQNIAFIHGLEGSRRPLEHKEILKTPKKLRRRDLILFTVCSPKREGMNEAQIVVQSLGVKGGRTNVSNGTNARYLSA